MPACIELNDVIPRLPGSPFTSPINWHIQADEVWGVVGPNGSGKSLLAELMQGKIAVQSGNIRYPFLKDTEDANGFIHPARQIKKIDFNSAYSLLDYRKLFYQQRFNNFANEEIPLVRDILKPENISEENLLLFRRFHLFDLMDRKLIHLSSGELRKFLIAKELLDNPRMLIFDNPFIGLDEESRESLNEMFAFLLERRDLRLLLLAPSIEDLPACATHILEMNDCYTVYRGKKSDYIAETDSASVSFPEEPPTSVFPAINWDDFTLEDRSFEGNEVVSMTNVDITYGKRIIQGNINWTVNKDEKWALLGPNGSGKSTLLSYIFADNPLAYTKNIRLFGRKRGTGESIWDIKQRIGFTSSEMHLYYRKNVDCLTVVTSGFFDSIGLFRKCNARQLHLAEKLLDIVRIPHLKNRSFLNVSSGEQRLVLFARAIIKNPELLILDEPFHGLDEHNKKGCTAIVESFARQAGKSLIHVTHRKEEIPSCIDHFMILRQHETPSGE